MDINNLYPTQSTFTQGLQNEYTAEVTAWWGNTYSGETVNDCSSYWLGYIKSDNLPPQYKRGILYIDEDANKVIIKNIVNAQQNFPCTYTTFESYGSTPCRYTLAQTVDGSTDTIYNNTLTRLFNQLYPEYIGLSYTSNTNYDYALNIDLYYVLFNQGDEIVNRMDDYKLNDTTSITFSRSTHGRLMVKSAYDFLFNNAEYTITIDGHAFTITAADLETGTAYITGDDGYKIRMFLFRYRINSYVNINSSISSSSQKPMGFVVKTSQVYREHTYEDLCVSNGVDAISVWYHRVGPTASEGLDNHTSPENPIFSYPYGFDDEIDLDEVLRINNYGSTSTGYPYGYSNHVFLHRDNQSGYGAKCILTPYFPIDSVQKTFALSIRVDVSGIFTPSYVSNFTYATDVKPDGEFLAKLKTGDITNATFKNSLREWQYEDLQSDDFTEEDIPPYTPPGPDPRPDPEPPEDDAEHGGDDIEPTPVTGLGGTFGFTTQYAMRGNQLEQLGSALWAGFDRNNPDIDAFIQNFVYSVDPDTGSVNMADIMEFFISLRAYPMPLGNLTSITAVGTDFYIGSGTAPLRLPNGTTPFTENLHTADSYIEPVNAGTVSIPFWFGDYRDYKTEITLYLPYCGTAELNPADVMGCTLDCTYVVDLSTGSCTAYVWTTTWENKKYPVAILPGQLGVDIPITATNAGRVGARLLGDRINFAENIMSVLKNTATGIGAVTSGNIGTGIRATMSAFIDPAIQEQKQLAGMADRGAIAAPMLSGGRGLAAFRNPATAYVQVRSPFYAVPEKYTDTVGDPAATRVQIRDCHGFNQFVNVDVSGITTDAADQAEIRRALENGIYI